jgi:hypothetical protein
MALRLLACRSMRPLPKPSQREKPRETTGDAVDRGGDRDNFRDNGNQIGVPVT